jgi:ribonuclease VapC
VAVVLDAHAVLALLTQEPGGHEVKELIGRAHPGAPCLMTVVNWGEVYYKSLRKVGSAEATQVMDRLAAMPILLVDADLPLSRQAAVFKATGGLSYADCFAAALAKRERAELVTGDREFKSVEDEIRIHWI